MAFWQRVVFILKSGSTMDDMVDLMANGHGCVIIPVIRKLVVRLKDLTHSSPWERRQC
jgi:hypothetical protein